MRKAAVSASGGPVTLIGAFSGIPQTNGSIAIWYDSRGHGFIGFDFNRRQVVRLQIGSLPDPRGTSTLCGNRLYFALSPDLEYPSITIRYVDVAAV